MYISRKQALSICNMVILSNFNYCTLIWLFCNKGANKKIDRAHKRALKILHNDYDSSIQSLLARSNSVTIHVQNLQKLMTEIYMSLNNMNPSIVWEFHEKKYVAYDLRKKIFANFQRQRQYLMEQNLYLSEVVSPGIPLMIMYNKSQHLHV